MECDFMGKYHNKLDKKYFDKSIYMKKFESTFGINSNLWYEDCRND